MTAEMEVHEQHFHVVPFIMLFKVALIFKSTVLKYVKLLLILICFD